MMQVLMNLGVNACDAMPDGGRLLIETEERHLRPGEAPGLPADRHGTFVCLRVSDTGEGMPEEVRARMFEPFFTTKRAGQSTGLGLAIVEDIVRKTEGWIECDSEVGHGARFTVWFPASAQRGALAPPSRTLAHKSILLVDNEPSIVTLAQTILKRYGYRVVSAENGRQALEIYRQKQAAIDLIILDQNMPGLSGLETMNELLAINSRAQVLLMTGGPAPPPVWTEGTPGWGFLSKPFTADQLVRAVRGVLAGERTAFAG
jgi:CheY-like chemotaxis protein